MAQILPMRAKLFVILTALLGATTLAIAMMHWHSDDPLRFFCYLLIAAMASRLKVKLPGIEGSISVLFLFVLLGVLELSLSETLLIGCAAALVQTVWNRRQPLLAVKLVFNVFSNTANAVSLSYLAYRLSAGPLKHSLPLMLAVSTCAYFVMNTLPVALIVGLTESKSFRSIWTECYFWTFPYMLAGAALVGFVAFANSHLGWQASLLALPVVYWIYHSYSLYLGRLEEAKKRAESERERAESEKCHVEEVSALQVRTIEALAMAIDAKDHTTHTHLNRVRTYALKVAEEMRLPPDQIEALRAAALLHDVGKLAVPDHIINKPGRLTPEEYEKMKIHPIVGAEILRKVNFPYPVAPIVRSHHEKWNGEGYPDGLRGEQIPIGARILAAVDCLDSLASDRQYRKALPLDKAMEHVAHESGISFDPKVVEILRRHYIQLEQLAVDSLRTAANNAKELMRDEVVRCSEPGAGLAHDMPSVAREEDFLASIASARQEAQTIFELSQDLGNSLSLDETLSLIAARIRKIIPYDAFVAFMVRGDVLVPEFVNGDNYRAFASLQIPLGEGLCGWVARNAKPIVNGNPMVEPGYGSDLTNLVELQSALAVPLEGVTGLVGVLALYQSAHDAFNSEHLRVLQAVTSKAALSIENAMKFRQVEHTATTDYLTGLPNTRALFMHLNSELARCKRENRTLTVMVCDLNGFKQINDLYGHLEGDRALKIFGQLLTGIFREYDYVARLGGDEFVVVAPDITAEIANQKITVMNTLAQQTGREVCRKSILSLSTGTAFYPQDGLDAEQLLASADKKMYALKRMHHERVPSPVVVEVQYSNSTAIN